MITIDVIKRIAKTGEKIQEGDYLVSVFKDDGWWVMSMYIPGKGGFGTPFSKRLTEETLQKMVDAIYEHIERMKHV